MFGSHAGKALKIIYLLLFLTAQAALTTLLPADHPERTHCARQGVQAQAEPETAPETRPRMPGPGHFPQGAGDGGGRSRGGEIKTAKSLSSNPYMSIMHNR